jgi:sialic acid synthase SpsE
MDMIILDFGSGNTCKNDLAYIKRMYDELKAVDSEKQEIVVKWQLFEQAGDNIPLTHKAFQFAFHYGRKLGYKVTSSIFDNESLKFLMQYDIDLPFIKIANNRNLDVLTEKIPRKTKVIFSMGDMFSIPKLTASHDDFLCCVSEYPAKVRAYEIRFSPYQLHKGISDHTDDFELYRKYNPNIIEWHYKLADSTGLDAGPFARTPEQLAEVIG